MRTSAAGWPWAVSRTWVESLPMTLSASFDGAADETEGFVGSDENFVVVGEVEGGEVGEDAVLVGHGQRDLGSFGENFEHFFAHLIERLLHGVGEIGREG